jgi:endonuclease G
MKKAILLSILAGLCLFVRSQKADILLPSNMDRESTIHHLAYSLSYNSSYILPSWVAYKITKTQVNKYSNVKARYVSDPEVTTRSASKKDYKEGGYLMAQLVNYLDVQQIQNSEKESFYMSNIVPMKLAFYNHIWLKTEELIRMWNANTDGLYIVCGPILTDAPFTTIGENNVSVPKRYYKAVYDPKNQKAVGFIFRNGSSSGSLKSYALSIDAIERETGIDLFQTLDNELENKIEAEFNASDWNFELAD